MKKIILMSLILVIAICIMGNVYAALSCNISLQSNKTKLNKNEEFVVDVKISNIQSDRGIIALEATLEYDKNSLELLKMEGKNGWETPVDEATYNSANGKIAIDRSGLGKNNETVFTITFKVKNTSKQNLVIALKDIIVADGTKPVNIAQANQNITVLTGTSTPDEQPKPDDDTNTSNNTINNNTSNTVTDKINTNKTNNANSNDKKNTIEKETIPYVGDNSIILAVLIGLLIIITTVLFVTIIPIKKKH